MRPGQIPEWAQRSQRTRTKYTCGDMKEITIILIYIYRNNPKYWNLQAFANSVDPDQMPQNAASDLGLHCLPYVQQYFRHIKR